MTYNVFGGTLNPTLLYYYCIHFLALINWGKCELSHLSVCGVC